MLDGSTAGRAFESAFGFWVWVVLCALATIWWLWERRRIARLRRDEAARRDRDG